MEVGKIDLKSLNRNHIDSYMTKEEFIEIINNLHFTHIKEADLYFITGFVYNAEDDTTKTLGFKIDIS